MNRIPTRFLLSLGIAVVVACAGGAGDAESYIEIGRPDKALPWLGELGDKPFIVVNYQDLPIARSVPQNTEYYQIDADVVASAYSYFFYVRGIDDNYFVGSSLNLAKLAHELGVLEIIKERNKGKEVAIGLGKGIKNIGSGLGNLVMHPGLSLKSVGTRIQQSGRSLERMIGTEEKVGRDEAGENRSDLGQGPAGEERRHLAAALGVDVYTTNPAIQNALVELSRLRTAGGLGTWAIPYHIGALNYFNPINGHEEAERIIRDFAPYELRRTIGERLEPILGMDREDGRQPLENLLMNPNYSPRGIAYMGLGFELLRDVGNLPQVAAALAGAETPEEADALVLQFRLFSLLHQRIEPLREFVPFANFFAAIGRNGVLYFMFFGDTLRPWQHTTDVFGMFLDEAKRMGATGVEFWTIGDVDPSMIARAEAENVRVHQSILRDPRLMPAPQQ